MPQFVAGRSPNANLLTVGASSDSTTVLGTGGVELPDSVGSAIIRIHAKEATTAVVAVWEIKLCWRQDASPDVTFVDTQIHEICRDTAAAGWSVSVAPNAGTSPLIQITVNGVASTVIEWGISGDYTVYQPYASIGATAAEAIDASETEIDVNNARLFALQDIIVVDSEHMSVGSGFATNTIQVTRGENGTTAATHSNGAPIYLRTRTYPSTPSETTGRLFMGAFTAEAVDISEVDIDVDDGTKFAVNDVIMIDNEQMFVLAVTSNTLNVTRAVYGSVANTHSTSVAIYRA